MAVFVLVVLVLGAFLPVREKHDESKTEEAATKVDCSSESGSVILTVDGKRYAVNTKARVRHPELLDVRELNDDAIDALMPLLCDEASNKSDP